MTPYRRIRSSIHSNHYGNHQPKLSQASYQSKIEFITSATVFVEGIDCLKGGSLYYIIEQRITTTAFFSISCVKTATIIIRIIKIRADTFAALELFPDDLKKESTVFCAARFIKI